MNEALAKDEVQEWLQTNLTADIRKLAFESSPFEGISMPNLLNQLQLRQHVRKKLPLWYQTKGLLYPQKVNIEQTSSARAAQYKSQWVQGKELIDVTGGFGVDSYYFAQKMEQVIHVEQNPDLQQIAAHNFRHLGANNIHSVLGDGIEFIDSLDREVDVIFIDPSRRADSNERVILLHEMQPDLLKHQNLLLQKANEVVVKLAPMLDLQYIMQHLLHIKSMHVVAVQNEVKEILVVQSREVAKENPAPQVYVVNLESEWKTLQFTPQLHRTAPIAEPKKYLYLPSSALMKVLQILDFGEFWKLDSLHPDTTIFTSDNLYENFPGEIFTNYHEINLKKGNFSNQSFRIIHRNYPLKIAQIKKKYRIKDDGTQILIFTQIASGSRIWNAAKINSKN